MNQTTGQPRGYVACLVAIAAGADLAKRFIADPGDFEQFASEECDLIQSAIVAFFSREPSR